MQRRSNIQMRNKWTSPSRKTKLALSSHEIAENRKKVNLEPSYPSKYLKAGHHRTAIQANIGPPAKRLSDCIRVMGARPSLLCYVHTSEHSHENAYCHLIGRDDENILSSCIDQSDDSKHLLRCLLRKQQRRPCTHHRKNKMTIKP